MSVLTDSSSRTSHGWNSYGDPSTGRLAHVTTVAPWSAKTALIPAPTPRTPPVTRTTRPLSPRSMPATPALSAPLVTVLAYQASACLGSRPCRRPDVDHHQVGRTGHRLGHRRLPARQRDPVPGVVRTRGRDYGRGPRPVHPRRDPSVRGPRVQRRRRHQGDAEDRGVYRVDRRQPRLLRGLPRGL